MKNASCHIIYTDQKPLELNNLKPCNFVNFNNRKPKAPLERKLYS